MELDSRTTSDQPLRSPTPLDTSAVDPIRRAPTIVEKPLSLQDFISTHYLPHIRTYKRSWKTDETLFRVHILPVLGKTSITQVRRELIARLLMRMSDNGYSSGTIGRITATLKHAFHLAQRWRFIEAANNPVTELRGPPDVIRSRFLCAEEAHRLLAALEVDANKTAAQAILLMLLTGARRNEITHAKWTDLLLDRKCLFVPVAKSGKPRIIVLNDLAIEVLRKVVRLPSNPFIFPSPITGRPSPSMFFPWVRIRRRAGLPDLRLHDLRHSFASFLINRGVSLYVVQQLLGHLHIHTTQRYSHLAPELLERGANAIADIFAGHNADTQYPSSR